MQLARVITVEEMPLYKGPASAEKRAALTKVDQALLDYIGEAKDISTEDVATYLIKEIPAFFELLLTANGNSSELLTATNLQAAVTAWLRSRIRSTLNLRDKIEVKQESGLIEQVNAWYDIPGTKVSKRRFIHFGYMSDPQRVRVINASNRRSMAHDNTRKQLALYRQQLGS